MRVLVLGGRGFIGRNVVNALLSQNIETVIGSRKFIQGPIESKQIPLHMFMNKLDWEPVIEGFDVIINCVGILRQRWGETYEAVHNKAPNALAFACKTKNTWLIHVSALGLSGKAESKFIRSKFEGERNLMNSGANVIVVRPSLLDGAQGFGARWMRIVSKWPFHPVAKANGQIAPLDVQELGEAIANIVGTRESLPTEIELGGNDIYTFQEYLGALRAGSTTDKAVVLKFPVWLVRLASHIFDALHITPLSFGHVELMQGYNVPNFNYLPILLKRNPIRIGVRLDSPSLADKLQQAEAL